jgi:hypothetical protein
VTKDQALRAAENIDRSLWEAEAYQAGHGADDWAVRVVSRGMLGQVVRSQSIDDARTASYYSRENMAQWRKPR